MKKTIRSIKTVFRHLISFFDKFLITPITKGMLKVMDLIKNNGQGIDKVISKKSSLIVISLVLAFAVFIVIDRESNLFMNQYAEVIYNHPVTAIYNEEAYVVEGLPETVDITLIGESRHIYLAKQSPTREVTVDLTGLEPGQHRVTLRYSQSVTSLDYTLDPSNIMVNIYEKVSETKPLTYELLHLEDLDSKLYINNVEIINQTEDGTEERSTVTVKGAEHQLAEVATIKALIDVNDITSMNVGDVILEDIPLAAYDTSGNIVDVEIVPSKVSAKLTITSPSKEVPVTIIPEGDVAFGMSIKSIESNISTVVIYGQQATINEITQITVPIDVTDLDEDREYIKDIALPAGITEISAKTVVVNITLDKLATKEYKEQGVQAENLDSNLKVQALTEADGIVTVVVQGSQNAIDALDESTIKAYIDLEGYGVGEHEIEVQVTGGDLKLNYSSKTTKVKVRITEK